MTALVAGFLLAVMTGLLLVRVLVGTPGWVLLITYGTGIGIGLFSLVSFALLHVFGRTAFPPIELTVMAVALVAAGTVHNRDMSGIQKSFSSPGSHDRVRLVLISALVACALALLWFVVFTVYRPHGDWDAWAIWNLRARFFVRAGAAWADAFDQAMLWSHPDYPLLVPLAVARLWSYAGSQLPTAASVIAGAFLIGTGGLLFGLLSSLTTRRQAMIAVAVFLGAPYAVKFGAAQQADLPSAFFALASAGAMMIAHRPERQETGWIFLAGLSAGLAGWTKNEGLLALLSLAAAMTVVGLPDPGRRGRTLLVFLAGGIPALLAIVWFKLTLAPASYLFGDVSAMADRLATAGRYEMIAAAYGQELLKLWMFFPLVVGAVLLGRTADKDRRREAAGVFLTLILILTGQVVVYAITPHDLAWQLGTSVNRLLMQVWPLLVFGVFLLVRHPDEFPAD